MPTPRKPIQPHTKPPLYTTEKVLSSVAAGRMKRTGKRRDPHFRPSAGEEFYGVSGDVFKAFRLGD